MHTFLEEEGLKQSLVGLALFPVTNHVHSQKTAENLGSKACGMALGLLPRTLVFKKLREEPLRQRESCLFHFKYLKPPGLSRIYAPEHHQEILRRIYRHLEIPVEFLQSKSLYGPGLLEVHYDSALGVGEILIKQIGEETGAEVRQARRDLCELARAAVVHLQIPLNQPGAPELFRLAEREGFFFSAVCPGFAEGSDAQRLQYLNTEIDTSLLKVTGSWAREILQYVERERTRVSRLATG
jgi:hypothetical protein